MTSETNSAKDVVFGAIAAGKHVVTANKALIAAFLPELQEALAAQPTVRSVLSMR
jgi:homoserine dehydrogenase